MKKIKPGPGQESVWDYPRPPRLEAITHTLLVEFGGEVIAQTSRGYRILETSHPPTYYFPPDDVRKDLLRPAWGNTICEFKGQASYFDIVVGERDSPRAAWIYPDPTPAYRAVKDYFCFYASRMDRCTVNGEEVQAQAGDFYGGWITSRVVGPFKGEPGTWGW